MEYNVKVVKSKQEILNGVLIRAIVRSLLCDSEVKLIMYLQSSISPSLLLCCVQVMVAEALDISRETYFAILMDRSCNGPVMVGSPQGGMDIEEVAASNPELIFKVDNL